MTKRARKPKYYSVKVEPCFKHDLYPCNKGCTRYGITDTMRLDWLDSRYRTIYAHWDAWTFDETPIKTWFSEVRQAIDAEMKKKKRNS